MPGEAKVSHSFRNDRLAEVYAGAFSTEIGCEQFVVLIGRHATQDSERPEEAA